MILETLQSQTTQAEPFNSVATLYFDGSAIPNPGPGSCGYVLTLQTKNGPQVVRGSEVVGAVTTNNVAEFHGLMLGLRAARQNGVDRVQVFGDSVLVINAAAGRWKCKKPHIRALAGQVQEIAKEFGEITFTWVPRGQNKDADKLSRLADPKTTPAGIAMLKTSSDLLTRTKVAGRLGVNPSTLWRLVKRGEFPEPIKVGRLPRWRNIEVDKWIETRAASASLMQAAYKGDREMAGS